ncbi:hypothetical protein TNIN_243341 [Trichonephila inaurata madagascariensis]|uniref:Uncharacterized protein n=1 Tax=Trichonephila inaurata madagascariensis TaxID=2747483 RepID=A0A8X6XIB2_9ARAC|nr:hypothetical protein TNIN_243341 [Trichonephila inaurata madagascariensis]
MCLMSHNLIPMVNPCSCQESCWLQSWKDESRAVAVMLCCCQFRFYITSQAKGSDSSDHGRKVAGFEKRPWNPPQWAINLALLMSPQHSDGAFAALGDSGS